MGLELTIPESIEFLLKAKNIPELKAVLFNFALEYILPLEGLTKDGKDRTPHSQQAPEGMVRKNIPAIETVLADSIREAIESISAGAEPRAALEEALESAVNFALTTVVLDTPIDTGRARQVWAIEHVGEVQDAVSLGVASGSLAPSKYAPKNPGSRKPKGESNE